MTSHARCRYISPQNIECEIWFATTELEYKLCPLHRDSISPQLAANGINKDEYIESRKDAELSCASMTDAELDAHIAKFEAIIEDAKMRALVGRATKRHRESLLTDEQRAERRKIQTPKLEGKRAKSESKTSVTIKSNPIKYMMERNGFTREQAIKMLGLTNEEASKFA